jgi:hypothetical protein
MAAPRCPRLGANNSILLWHDECRYYLGFRRFCIIELRLLGRPLITNSLDALTADDLNQQTVGREQAWNGRSLDCVKLSLQARRRCRVSEHEPLIGEEVVMGLLGHGSSPHTGRPGDSVHPRAERGERAVCVRQLVAGIVDQRARPQHVLAQLRHVAPQFRKKPTLLRRAAPPIADLLSRWFRHPSQLSVRGSFEHTS